MTQPTPHYCEHPTLAIDDVGCPRWPACVTLDPDGVTVLTLERGAATQADASAAALDAVRAHVAATISDQEAHPLGESLASLAGMAAGAVIFLVVAAILLPLFV